jgi:hypothetical protein
MKQMEDTLNVSVCDHILILLAEICFDAFSLVTVQYEKS